MAHTSYISDREGNRFFVVKVVKDLTEKTEKEIAEILNAEVHAYTSGKYENYKFEKVEPFGVDRFKLIFEAKIF